MNPYALPNLIVGVDAHIDPAEHTVFTEISGEFAATKWADAGIGPYRQPLYSSCFSWYSWFSASMGVSVSTVMASSARRSSAFVS